MASVLDLVDLVVLGDWLLRKRLTTRDALVEVCGNTHARHVVHARRAAAYVRDRVDSPMETRLRMLLVLAGLPEPVVNLTIRDDDGSVLMRLDLSYPRIRLAAAGGDEQRHLQGTAADHRPGVAGAARTRLAAAASSHRRLAPPLPALSPGHVRCESVRGPDLDALGGLDA